MVVSPEKLQMLFGEEEYKSIVEYKSPLEGVTDTLKILFKCYIYKG